MSGAGCCWGVGHRVTTGASAARGQMTPQLLRAQRGILRCGKETCEPHHQPVLGQGRGQGWGQGSLSLGSQQILWAPGSTGRAACPPHVSRGVPGEECGHGIPASAPGSCLGRLPNLPGKLFWKNPLQAKHQRCQSPEGSEETVLALAQMATCGFF